MKRTKDKDLETLRFVLDREAQIKKIPFENIPIVMK